MVETANRIFSSTTHVPLTCMVVAESDAETTLASAWQLRDAAAVRRRRRTAQGGRRATPALNLCAQVLRLLDERLPNCIVDLEVSYDGDRIVLHGVAPSFYVKQIAQTVVMAAKSGTRLANLIEVRPPR